MSIGWSNEAGEQLRELIERAVEIIDERSSQMDDDDVKAHAATWTDVLNTIVALDPGALEISPEHVDRFRTLIMEMETAPDPYDLTYVSAAALSALPGPVWVPISPPRPKPRPNPAGLHDSI